MILVGLLGVGCAAPSYVAGKRVAPAAVADVTHTEERFSGAHDVQLLAQAWRPAAEPKGVFVIVHGLKDYADHYAELAVQLVGKGYAVHAFDLRGHGDSEGDRVWVDEFDDYLADLEIFLKRVGAKEGVKPTFLFGHSMGGAIVTLYTITRKPPLAGLVLSAPGIKSTAGAVLSGMVSFFSVIAPSLAVFELDDEQFSRDPKVVAGMRSDPLIYDGAGPAQTAAEVLDAIDRIQAGMENVEVPLLALHGTVDVVTLPEGSKELVERARSKDKTLRLWDGLYHDLLHEPEKQQVIDAIIAWVDARKPPEPPAPPVAAPPGS